MADDKKSCVKRQWRNIDHEMEALRVHPAALALLRGAEKLDQDRIELMLITLPTLPVQKEGAEHGES